MSPIFSSQPTHSASNDTFQVWKRTFSRYDNDRSGTIDRAELHNALTDFGYFVIPELLDILQQKYGLYC